MALPLPGPFERAYADYDRHLGLVRTFYEESENGTIPTDVDLNELMRMVGDSAQRLLDAYAQEFRPPTVVYAAQPEAARRVVHDLERMRTTVV